MLKKMLVFLLLLFAFNPPGIAQSPPVKAYKDWKAEKAQQITAKLNGIKVRLEVAKAKRPIDRAAIENYERLTSQEQWNLEIAQELSVTDYIALYLVQQTSKKRFQEAASQLSSNEIAELIEAYTQSIGAQAEPESLEVTTGRNKYNPKISTQAVQNR